MIQGDIMENYPDIFINENSHIATVSSTLWEVGEYISIGLQYKPDSSFDTLVIGYLYGFGDGYGHVIKVSYG